MGLPEDLKSTIWRLSSAESALTAGSHRMFSSCTHTQTQSVSRASVGYFCQRQCARWIGCTQSRFGTNPMHPPRNKSRRHQKRPRARRWHHTGPTGSRTACFGLSIPGNCSHSPLLFTFRRRQLLATKPHRILALRVFAELPGAWHVFYPLHLRKLPLQRNRKAQSPVW